jgi:2-keto-3-deoxy-L-rhamnonate aldolase RhmA
MTMPSLKEKIREKRPLLGGFIFSSDSNISELYAEAGYDFVIIDTEHALNDLRIVQAHVRACAAARIHALVRLGAANYTDGSRLLDAGVEGLMIPHLGHDLRANDVVRAMKYWPEGSRATCTGVQIAGYGQRHFAEVAAQSNQNVVSVGLIEDQACVERIEQVLQDSHVDWIMPGPADLASSYGLHGQLTHLTIQDAVSRVIAAAQARQIKVGVYVNELSEIEAWKKRQIDFFVHAIDYKILGKALRAAAIDFQQRVLS